MEKTLGIILEKHSSILFIFSDRQKWVRIVEEFIGQGLENGEKILYIADILAETPLALLLLVNNNYSFHETGRKGQFDVLAGDEAWLEKFSDPVDFLNWMKGEIEIWEDKPFGLRFSLELTLIQRLDNPKIWLEVFSQGMMEFLNKSSNLKILVQFDLTRLDDDFLQLIIGSFPVIFCNF